MGSCLASILSPSLPRFILRPWPHCITSCASERTCLRQTCTDQQRSLHSSPPGFAAAGFATFNALRSVTRRLYGGHDALLRTCSCPFSERVVWLMPPSLSLGLLTGGGTDALALSAARVEAADAPRLMREAFGITSVSHPEATHHTEPAARVQVPPHIPPRPPTSAAWPSELRPQQAATLKLQIKRTSPTYEAAGYREASTSGCPTAPKAYGACCICQQVCSSSDGSRWGGGWHQCIHEQHCQGQRWHWQRHSEAGGRLSAQWHAVAHDR